MSAEGFTQFTSKKAYEICYALFRLAGRIKHESFADHLEDRGLELLLNVVSENHKQAQRVVQSIDYLVRIGSDINIISPVNADLVSMELQHLNAAIAELSELGKDAPVVLDDIFSKPPTLSSIQEKSLQQKIESPIVVSTGGNGDVPISEIVGGGFEPAFAVSSGGGGVLRSAIRQSAILDKIRQFGNLLESGQGCRLRDLQDHFKETSERTIRYDIQNLIERGVIERFGNGGPSTYYKVKEV